MAVKRGAIYLANFNPGRGAEPGKIRPCLVMQSDLLNEVGHPSTAVLPLTTQLLDDAKPLRFRLHARDELRADSDVMIDQIRTIDNRRFMDDALTALSAEELAIVSLYLGIALGLEPA